MNDAKKTAKRRSRTRPSAARPPALPASRRVGLRKAPSGISGLDQITGGGLPKGRPTLVCGGPGCGKTLLAMEFLVRGAVEFEEPGVFMAFEENTAELAENVASLGLDLASLVADGKLALDWVRIVPGELEQSGEWDLEGLFIRLGHAIDRVKAKRVVLDTVECLFAGLPDPAILRAELQRLFRFLKEKGVTAVVTGERGDATLTRHGLEEYVSDCVILLDHRVTSQLSTRRLRIVKYRGSTHGADEYPFLIDAEGISILPITAVTLDHAVSTERISTGVQRLDAMLGGKGIFRGTSVLVSGTAGTGKTTLACHIVRAACERGERALYFAFEEAEAQIVRNMRSVGLALQKWCDAGLLAFVSGRPTSCGLEMHLLTMLRGIERFAPAIVVVDPVNTFVAGDNAADVKIMLVRLIDALKNRGCTAILTSLTAGGGTPDRTDTEVSSLIDTWLVVSDLPAEGEMNRLLHVLKSRGMAHSNQVREFRISGSGIDLVDVYAGPSGVLTGSARLTQEARERAETAVREAEIARRRRALARKKRELAHNIALLERAFADEADETESELALLAAQGRQRIVDRAEQERSRSADRRRRSNRGSGR